MERELKRGSSWWGLQGQVRHCGGRSVGYLQTRRRRTSARSFQRRLVLEHIQDEADILCRDRVGVVSSVLVRRKALVTLPPPGDSTTASQRKGGTFSLFPSPSRRVKEVLARLAQGLLSGVKSFASVDTSSVSAVDDDDDDEST